MTQTVTLTKGRDATLFTLQTVGSNTAINGPSVDVSTKIGGTAKVRFGRSSTISISAALPELRIEGSGTGVGGADTMWPAIYSWTPGNGANAVTQITTTGAGAASTQLEAAAWTGITASDGLVFILDTTVANSEFARVAAVAGSLLTFQRTLTNAHASATTKVSDQAEEWNIPLDFVGEEVIRMVVDNAKNAVTVPVYAQATLVYTASALIT